MRNLELNENSDFEGKYGFVFDHTFITNPIESMCGRFDANPEEYGFKLFDTGWDCIGHAQSFILNNKVVLMLICNMNKPVNKETIGAQVLLCDPNLIDESLEDSIIDRWVISR